MTRREWIFGVTVAPMAGQSPTTISISVFGLFDPKALEIQAPSGSVVELSAGANRWAIEGHATSPVSISDGFVTVESPTGTVAAEIVDASGRDGFILAVPGRIKRRFAGRLTIKPSADTLQALVEMPIESAVAAILRGESGQQTPYEALAAQAIVSRSYLLAAPRHEDFDFCDTTHCQYVAEAPEPGSPIAQAVSATARAVLMADGAVIPAMYSRSCGGTTVSSDEAELPGTGYRFRSVECSVCRENPEHWGSRLTVAQAAQVSRVSDEPGRLQAAAKLGWNTLPSRLFELGGDPAAPSVHGAGRGHGVGLCQRGAASLAEQGWDARRILAHYFPDSPVSER